MAIPHVVLAIGLLWTWLIMPLPVYGTLPSKTDQAGKLLPPVRVDTSDGLRIDGELIADRELLKAARGSRVVLYSAAGKEAEDLTVARFTQETGIPVELTRLANNKLAERALSEYGAGRLGADVIRLTDPRTARDFSDRRVFMPYRTPFHDVLNEQGSPPNESWFSPYYFVKAVGYNSAILDESPPAGWQDIVSPRYEGKLGIVSVTTGGTLSSQLRFELETFGADFVAAQARQGARVFDSTSTQVDALARGEITVATVSVNNAIGAEAAGAPIRLVIPKEGVSATQGPLELTGKGVANPAARVFANWSLSKSGQRFVGAQGFVPVRTDIGVVRAGSYELPMANSPRFHLMSEDDFARYAREDEDLWRKLFDYVG
ncbi:ABC transporter substrate-binding protein [Saccharopolyspora sp. ASAGF58]|uniref:ABC transporter substrate-binding protein n=1 Tax=Saccharopolyspora sp. ASAGF58 TaxID=2719023 RepID=UPI001FF0D3FD|nr:extracellular solute-binding protein [Saccharopolyspora sp. ASAGF58]